MLKKSLFALSLISLAACNGGGGSGGGKSGRSIHAQFVDAPTEGLQYYENGEESDYRITGADGYFTCTVGSKVTFSLRAGFTDIGSITCGPAVVFPMDLDLSKSPAGERADIPKYVALILHQLDTRFDGVDYSFSAPNVDQPDGKLKLDTSHVPYWLDIDQLDDTLTVVRLASSLDVIRDYRMIKEDCPSVVITQANQANWVNDTCVVNSRANAGSNPKWFPIGNNQTLLDAAIAEIDTHLATSCANFGNGNSSCSSYNGGGDEDEDEGGGSEPDPIINFEVPTEQELVDFIAENGVEDIDANRTRVCLTINNSGEGVYALLIGGTKYAHFDDIKSFEACTITVSNHPSVEVGLTFDIANFESSYVGKFFKKSNDDIRFAQNCPSSDATFAGVINNVCETDPVNP